MTRRRPPAPVVEVLSSVVDDHGTARRELEFLPTSDERRAFVGKVVALLEHRRLLARAELVGRDRVYFYAQHPYGPERSMTFVVRSEHWADSASGNPVNAADVATQLVAACRRRSP